MSKYVTITKIHRDDAFHEDFNDFKGAVIKLTREPWVSERGHSLVGEVVVHNGVLKLGEVFCFYDVDFEEVSGKSIVDD